MYCTPINTLTLITPTEFCMLCEATRKQVSIAGFERRRKRQERNQRLFHARNCSAAGGPVLTLGLGQCNVEANHFLILCAYGMNPCKSEDIYSLLSDAKVCSANRLDMTWMCAYLPRTRGALQHAPLSLSRFHGLCRPNRTECVPTKEVVEIYMIWLAR